MFYGNSADNTCVRNADCVPDNGECVLDEKLFDNIPDTALCNMYIARGDIENIMVDDYSHKISVITYVVFQFILIREVEFK